MDEEIVTAAERDIAVLRETGFTVVVDVEIYGCVEARVSLHGEERYSRPQFHSRSCASPRETNVPPHSHGSASMTGSVTVIS